MVKFVVPTLLVCFIWTSIHQIFSSHLITEPRSDERLWCVVKFPLHWLQTYNATMNLFKMIVPFSINLISAVILLITFSRTKQKTANKTYISILKTQFAEHNDLILSPILITGFKLPVLIIVLAIKCIKFKWQLYLSTACYLLAIVPVTATFGIFILPAPSYIKTFIHKWNKLFKRR
jgi:hypothetical protein